MNQELINNLTKMQNRSAKEIADLRRYRANLEAAVNAFLEKKYALLMRALGTYDTIEGIHEAYGYGWIGHKQYTKLSTLAEEYETDTTRELLAGTLADLDEKISRVAQRAERIKMELWQAQQGDKDEEDT